MQTIKVRKDQTLLDIALQEYGGVNGVFFLVEDNKNLIGITDSVFEGDDLLIRKEIINKQMVSYLREYEIATAKEVRGEGIGYWRIGKDFIVS